MKRGIKYFFIEDLEIQDRIGTGEVDPYDIIFAKTSHSLYVVKEDLSLFNIVSKTLTFLSVADANRILNENTDTYPGQLVSIFNSESESYEGYLVNKNSETNEYYVTQISNAGGETDYNALQNIPVTNLYGEGIILSNQNSGLFLANGTYKYSANDPTVKIATRNTLFFIEKNGPIIQIGADTAKKITFSEDAIIEREFVTEEYLHEHEYTTSEDVETIINDNFVASDEDVINVLSL